MHKLWKLDHKNAYIFAGMFNRTKPDEFFSKTGFSTRLPEFLKEVGQDGCMMTCKIIAAKDDFSGVSTD